jgi:hypothetical protein
MTTFKGRELSSKSLFFLKQEKGRVYTHFVGRSRLGKQVQESYDKYTIGGNFNG